MRIADDWQRPFLLDPIYPGAWRALAREPAGLLVQRLDELGMQPGNAAVDAVRVLKLPFYPRWILCDLQFAAGADARKGEAILCLYRPDGCTPIDGRSERVRGHNDRHGVSLETEERRTAYLEFFCTAVFGEEGPFRIVHPSTPLERTGNNEAPIDPDKIVPLRPIAATKQGDRGIECTVSYGRTLFTAEFVVDAEGTVVMVDDSQILDMVAIKPELQFEGSRRRLLAEVAG